MTDWTAIRTKGDKTRAAFASRMGRRDANGHNTALGPGAHKPGAQGAVSVLSPYIRRRLELETGVVTRAIAMHGPEDAAKFVQVVNWRGYCKGWLERRLRRDVDRAMNSQTGLACFDGWNTELIDNGYLHNQARMWCAPIWMFTQGLPWRLGAGFFYRHHLGGDAATNTLGGRWVVGLHKRGKPDLVEVTQGLKATKPDGLPTVMPLRAFKLPRPDQPTALLITDMDCLLEDFDLYALTIRTTATLKASQPRLSLRVSDLVRRFEGGALADAATRAGYTATAMRADDTASLSKCAAVAGTTQTATPYITRSPLREWLDEAALAKAPITLREWLRDWDMAIWPHATAGFFKVKQNIPHMFQKALSA